MAKQLPYPVMREIFSRFENSEPEPKGELNHVNAYTLVVAVALSAQATDKGVNKATEALFKSVDTPQKMLDLGEDGLIAHIKTIGLYKTKARNVMKMAQILVEEFGGEVPNSRAALQSLPGVGRKTANVVLNMWWQQPAQAVDTHIFRVGNRAGIAPGKTVDQVERAIEDNVPADFQLHAHHWLILHGRYICVARKPKCRACIISDLCQCEEKTQGAKPIRWLVSEMLCRTLLRRAATIFWLSMGLKRVSCSWSTSRAPKRSLQRWAAEQKRQVGLWPIRLPGWDLWVFVRRLLAGLRMMIWVIPTPWQCKQKVRIFRTRRCVMRSFQRHVQ